MNSMTNILVDVRENQNLRGFHVLASLYLIADQLQSVRLYRLGGDEPNERTAVQSFSFDTGLRFHSIWQLLMVDHLFDLYLSAANQVPSDKASLAAQRTSRRSVLSLMFSDDPNGFPKNGLLLNGHSTRALADALLTALKVNGPLQTSAWREYKFCTRTPNSPFSDSREEYDVLPIGCNARC
jgi:hypothetical protein